MLRLGCRWVGRSIRVTVRSAERNVFDLLVCEHSLAALGRGRATSFVKHKHTKTKLIFSRYGGVCRFNPAPTPGDLKFRRRQSSLKYRLGVPRGISQSFIYSSDDSAQAHEHARSKPKGRPVAKVRVSTAWLRARNTRLGRRRPKGSPGRSLRFVDRGHW